MGGFEINSVNEIWKSVHYSPLNIKANKFGHMYSVSNLGRVKNNWTGKILKNQLKKHEYEVVDLSGKQYKVHRLVAFAFVENPDKDKNNIVNHIDGNKLNNHYSNLEWCDHDYNLKHASKHGLLEGKTRGENNGRALLTEEDVLDVWINDRDIKYIVDRFGMTELSAKALKNKQNWRYLIPKYLELAPEGHEEYIAKKRRIEDSRHKSALTDEQVKEVIHLLQKGISCAQIGRDKNVSDKIISSIKNRNTNQSKRVYELLSK
ncbi:NUMOD4 domain-containing protein [Paenibacillus polymyxa]|uniref:NUMOD4 domain-containing protein n=1 Tax=Paenibacillus polymyxa TaxID=1406 RepID=UPI0039BC9D1D